MQTKLAGIGISPGIAAGRAHLWHPGESDVPRYRVPKAQVGDEIARFDAALGSVRADLEAMKAQERGRPGAAEITAFIDLYLQLLNDELIADKPKRTISARGQNAEWALKEQVDEIGEHFRRVEDPYLRERGGDIVHVMNRVLTAMAGGARPPSKKPDRRAGRARILIAKELDPADVIELKRRGYEGFATDSGGPTSHAAILARSMGIPALAGLGESLAKVREGERVIIDADANALIINADPAAMRDAKARMESSSAAQKNRRPKKSPPIVKSQDGAEVSLQANIEFPAEAEAARREGADGIGLFRTEFLFLNRDDEPDEEEQFEIYRALLREMSPLPVTFRTLDLGADKMPGGRTESAAANPALGLRAIRYCLAEPQIFLSQLRALYRAAKFGRLQILLPMLSHPSEMTQAANFIAAARTQVAAADSAPDAERILAAVPIGGMIEVPASVFIMPALARQLDFFAIGTNDLIQYTLAIDRGDEKLAPLYDPLHPAVLRLLSMTVSQAKRQKREVALCGEIAGDANFTRLCLCLGLRRFSMSSHQIPAVREAVAEADIKRLLPLAKRVARAQTPESARAALAELNAVR